MMPISEHAFTIAAIQAFYLVKHKTEDLLFGNTVESLTSEESKKKKRPKKKNETWKQLKDGMRG